MAKQVPLEEGKIVDLNEMPTKGPGRKVKTSEKTGASKDVSVSKTTRAINGPGSKAITLNVNGNLNENISEPTERYDDIKHDSKSSSLPLLYEMPSEENEDVVAGVCDQLETGTIADSLQNKNKHEGLSKQDQFGDIGQRTNSDTKDSESRIQSDGKNERHNGGEDKNKKSRVTLLIRRNNTIIRDKNAIAFSSGLDNFIMNTSEENKHLHRENYTLKWLFSIVFASLQVMCTYAVPYKLEFPAVLISVEILRTILQNPMLRRVYLEMEHFRLATFHYMGRSLDETHVLLLAREGFYYDQDGHISCYHCNCTFEIGNADSRVHGPHCQAQEDTTESIRNDYGARACRRLLPSNSTTAPTDEFNIISIRQLYYRYSRLGQTQPVTDEDAINETSQSNSSESTGIQESHETPHESDNRIPEPAIPYSPIVPSEVYPSSGRQIVSRNRLHLDRNAGLRHRYGDIHANGAANDRSVASTHNACSGGPTVVRHSPSGPRTAAEQDVSTLVSGSANTIYVHRSLTNINENRFGDLSTVRITVEQTQPKSAGNPEPNNEQLNTNPETQMFAEGTKQMYPKPCPNTRTSTVSLDKQEERSRNEHTRNQESEANEGTNSITPIMENAKQMCEIASVNTPTLDGSPSTNQCPAKERAITTRSTYPSLNTAESNLSLPENASPRQSLTHWNPVATKGRKTHLQITTRFPKYASWREREGTFENTDYFQDNRRQMVQAGQFYIGPNDKTCCYECGNCLRDWQKDEDPAKEHLKHFPDCTLSRQPIFDSGRPPGNQTDIQGNEESDDSLTEENENMQEILKCRLCQSRPREVICLPCRHIVLCRRCCDNTKACPACGIEIERHIVKK